MHRDSYNQLIYNRFRVASKLETSPNKMMNVLDKFSSLIKGNKNRIALVLGAASALLFILIFSVKPTAAGNCFYFSDDVGFVCDGRMDPEPVQFKQPDFPERSFLDSVSYAYMEDNINIYPEPSLAAPPIYNVGEGFLYVTIQGKVSSEGQLWYQINPGEYALAEQLRLVTASDFRGMEIAVQPEHPFGWIVQEVRPSSEPDGEPNPDYDKLVRFDFFEVFEAEIAEDGWIWYKIGEDRWIRQTYVSLIDVNKPPEEVGDGEYWVEVDLYEQTFAAYEGDRMVYATLISSGLNKWPTREGLFQVWSRFERYKMSGAEGKVDYYYLEDVPYIMYFDELKGIGLHGTYWHDRFGYKHSHGCVNMPILDAEWVFNWSNNATNDLWVRVHISDPTDIFNQ